MRPTPPAAPKAPLTDLLRILLAALALPLFLAMPLTARAEGRFTALWQQVTDWKAVYGQIEARNRVPARARLAGTLVTLDVSEGDQVQAGQPLGRVVDEKIAFELNAIDAGVAALEAQLANAESELKRGRELTARGIASAQQLDLLRTEVEVHQGRIAAERARRRVVEQQAAEGEILAPISGRVLSVPLAPGAVVMAGETVATLGGGGVFLRLAVPERFAATLREGAQIEIEAPQDATPEGVIFGRLVRIYPLIEGGRVSADVEVPDLPARFIAARLPVRLPLAERRAILVPSAAISTRSGLDFVTVLAPEALGSPAADPVPAAPAVADPSVAPAASGAVQDALSGRLSRLVVPGQRRSIEGAEMVEIVSGLQGGEVLVLP